jgi:hypothetical protein
LVAVDAVAELVEQGVGRGDLVALVVAPRTGAALATPAGTALTFAFADVERVVQRVEEAMRPRWVTWSNATAVPLVEAGIRVATGWDIAAVHRLLFGGWQADPARVWAHLHDLASEAIPAAGPPDLFSSAADTDGTPDAPIRRVSAPRLGDRRLVDEPGAARGVGRPRGAGREAPTRPSGDDAQPGAGRDDRAH